MSDFKFKQPCVNCKNSTLNRCISCWKPLCNRCKSRVSINIPLTDNVIPKGICKKCKEILLFKGSMLSAENFYNFLKNLAKGEE